CPQLNSTCSLKSSNLELLMISGPGSLATSVPSSIVQRSFRLGSLNRQPVKSLPLNKVTGMPHWGVPWRFNAGAFTPVQAQEVPLGLVAVPTSRPPTSFPLNKVSSLKRSEERRV